MKVEVTNSDWRTGRKTGLLCPVALAINRCLPTNQFAEVGQNQVKICILGNPRAHRSVTLPEHVIKAITLYDNFGEQEPSLEFELPD